jgi:hypothetical protein
MIETYQRNYNLTYADLIAFALDLVNAKTMMLSLSFIIIS